MLASNSSNVLHIEIFSRQFVNRFIARVLPIFIRIYQFRCIRTAWTCLNIHVLVSLWNGETNEVAWSTSSDCRFRIEVKRECDCKFWRAFDILLAWRVLTPQLSRGDKDKNVGHKDDCCDAVVQEKRGAQTCTARGFCHSQQVSVSRQKGLFSRSFSSYFPSSRFLNKMINKTQLGSTLFIHFLIWPMAWFSSAILVFNSKKSQHQTTVSTQPPDRAISSHAVASKRE